MPARSVIAAIAVVVAACAASACKRVTYYRPPPISGVRFFASSKLSGERSDTLFVSVSGRNGNRQMREITLGGCPDWVLVRAIAAKPYLKSWSSAAWRKDSLARLLVRRDTTPDGRPIIYGACSLVLPVRMMAPGDSGGLAAIALSVRSVLGDSLPPGRYRIEAQLVGNGAKAGFLRAGEVELRLPGT